MIKNSVLYIQSEVHGDNGPHIYEMERFPVTTEIPRAIRGIHTLRLKRGALKGVYSASVWAEVKPCDGVLFWTLSNLGGLYGSIYQHESTS
jgi:hypothetical protein